MHVYQVEKGQPKGWFAGPWNGPLPVSVGYANCGIDEPHVHTQITEIYMVARGSAEMRVEQTTVHLETGMVVIITPGEAHTFVASSSDYMHYVIHAPGLDQEAARAEKVMVDRARLFPD